MKTIRAKIGTHAGLLALVAGLTTPLHAGDATTALFERLNKGDCLPSSLTASVWTITTGAAGTHGELNWGDELVFEQTGRTRGLDAQGEFIVWKNGIPWRSADGWRGSCVRDGNQSLYVVTGTVVLDGCLHELAFGRLDHDDTLGKRIEVIFEYAETRTSCSRGHRDALRHPGHAHGNND